MKKPRFVRAASIAFVVLQGVSSTACFVEPDPEFEPTSSSAALTTSLNHNCTQSQIDEASRSELLARYILQPEILHPVVWEGDDGGDPHWIMDRFFYQSDSNGYSSKIAGTLRHRLDNMRVRMDRGDLKIKCRNLSGTARVIPIGRDVIALDRDNFFNREAWYQASVFVHELSHEQEWTRDQQYGDAERRLWDDAARRTTHDKVAHWRTPFDNAENYEAFTYALIGEHFDLSFQDLYGEPIGETRFRREVERVMDGRDFKWELDMTELFLGFLADGEDAEEDDLDLIREHLHELGDGDTFAVFAAAYEHDPLTSVPLLRDAVGALANFDADAAPEYFRSLFVARLMSVL